METLRLPFNFGIETRDSTLSKDAKIVNGYLDQVGDRVHVVKRPAIVSSGATMGSSTGQGLFTFSNKLVGVVNNTLYSNTGSGASTSIGSLSGTTNNVSFTKTLSDSFLFFHKGDKAYTYNGTTLSQVTSDRVFSVTITSGGSGYTSAPGITFQAPGAGTTATATSTISAGLNAFTVTNQGSGYTYATISFSGGAGVGASATATITSGKVTAITLNTPGTGYSSAPTVVIKGNGSGAAATVTLQNGIVTSITVTNAGSGYTTAPNITVGNSWVASTHFNLNDQIFWNGNLYTVTTAGTTSTSGPTHTSGTVANGTTQLAYSGPAGQATCLLNGFPTGTICPGTSYFDSYVFVMTTDGKIWNSEPEDPTSWDALNFITAQNEPDAGVALAKHLNYLVAFGEWSTQFFYDAGNATGSPLLPNDSSRLEIGCATGYSVVEIPQSIIWIGVSKNTGRRVYMLEGLQPQPVSTSPVEKILNASTLSSLSAYAIEISGHYFYVLNLFSDGITLIMDIKSKQWYVWTSFVSSAETYLDGAFYTSFNNKHWALDRLDGNLYNISESSYTDQSGAIQFRVRTPLVDANSNQRKFLRRFELIGDRASTTVSVAHTDDDYQTWTSYRTVDMSVSRPVLYQCGSFRRRAYEIFHTGNTSLRLMSIEFELEGGGT